MPIDTYSLCPGGTGKKIKFCCPDFLGELEKIDRMLEGDQHLACLNHIERLQQQWPDRACLLAIKGMLLRASGQMEAAAANAARFVEKHPHNATALAESAILTAFEQGGRSAMPKLQQALAASADGLQNRLYDALGVVAQFLLADGQWLACRALLRLQLAVAQDDRHALEMLVELNRAAEVPLLLKDERPLAPCPDGAPWKARFDAAMDPVALGNWQAAADGLSALAAAAAESPAVWQNLATVRGWLADTSGCIEALRRYAALDVPLEDAVEAETLAMLLADNPLGDAMEVLTVTWTIRDVERLQTQLLSDARVAQVPFDPSSFTDDDNPPPKAVYLLLDRAAPTSAENITLENMPCYLGQAMLYGRQTDREARLEVLGITSADLPHTQALLGELAGDALDPQPKQEVVAQVSASQELLQHKWRPPRDISRQQIETLTAAFRRQSLLEKWPQLKLGIFEGRSPREVAADPGCRVKLLAAIMVLQTWNDHAPGDSDFNQLRSALGLPTLDPLDPQQTPVAELPLVRLYRVLVERCSDEALVLGYRRAVAFGVTAAVRKFARAVIDRPSLAGREEQLRAYSILARTAADSDQALQYVEQGRKAAESVGESSAPWDLLELSFRFGRGEAREAIRLINHIQREHMEEPGVAETLTRMMIQVGLLRPDGTPAGPRPPQGPPMPDEAPNAEPGKLWTPESQQPAGKGKLWVPE